MLSVRFSLLLVFAAGLGISQPHSSRLNYPLTLKTRWTYHLRQELGPGVHFSDKEAGNSKGNVMENTVISEVAGTDPIGNAKYTRIESRRNGKPYLTEWYRVTPEGLFVGKTIDYDGGNETVMAPPQRRLNQTLRPGESWTWKAANAPVIFHTTVVGTAPLDVPAGHFQAVHLLTNGTIQTPVAQVRFRQNYWFVRGVGYAKIETNTSAGTHQLTHVILTLEKLELPN